MLWVVTVSCCFAFFGISPLQPEPDLGIVNDFALAHDKFMSEANLRGRLMLKVEKEKSKLRWSGVDRFSVAF